jgi:hypothetical protein
MRKLAHPRKRHYTFARRRRDVTSKRFRVGTAEQRFKPWP